MQNPNFTARNKAVSVPFQGGIHYGIVRRVVGSQVYVELRAVAPGYAFGPCVVSGVDSIPAVNDSVICAFLNNAKSELVVLGKIASSTAPSVSLDGGSA
jgi:hypothetical protein